MTGVAAREASTGAALVTRHLDATGSAELDTAPVGELLARLSALPDLTRIDVYPDITRKTWGFPAGITTLATGSDPIVYPMAVPDVACGFLVVATGIRSQDWSVRHRTAFLDAVTRQIGVDSPHRTPVRIDLDTVFATGAAALGPPNGFDRDDHLVEQTTNCTPRPDLILPKTRADLTAEAGSVAGHRDGEDVARVALL